jgi:hypothetical protein
MDQLTKDVVSNAAAALKNFNQRANGKLDFSEASLAAVEELLNEASHYRDQLPKENADIIVKTLGCYILEVARKQLGGIYSWYSKREQPALLIGQPEFRIAIITWDKVEGRLSGDSSNNIPFFYAGFRDRVKAARKGDDAFYV